MQQHIRRSGAIIACAVALFILTIACSSGSAATPPSKPTQVGTFRHRLPSGDTAEIGLWRNPDDSYEAKLHHDRAGQTSIGALQRHFPDMPGQAVLFHLQGSDYIILGTLDQTISGTLDTIQFTPAGADRTHWMESLKVAAPSRTTPPVFAIIIRADEIDKWQGVQSIAIKTRESLKQGVDGTSSTGSAWEKAYDPPVPLTSLFIDIQP